MLSVEPIAGASRESQCVSREQHNLNREDDLLRWREERCTADISGCRGECEEGLDREAGRTEGVAFYQASQIVCRASHPFLLLKHQNFFNASRESK